METNNTKPSSLHSLQQKLINVNNNYHLINYFINFFNQLSDTIFQKFCQFWHQIGQILVNFCTWLANDGDSESSIHGAFDELKK